MKLGDSYPNRDYEKYPPKAGAIRLGLKQDQPVLCVILSNLLY